MVEYEGRQIERDGRGKYRCPNKCHDPNWPAPSWVSDKGFLKHLLECKGGRTVWTPEPVKERIKFFDCEDCGATIWMFSAFWEMRERTVCLDCYKPYFDQGIGFHSSAGLVLPHITLSV